MNTIINILNGLKSGVDFETANHIITDKILDSIDIASLIATLEDEFNIEIGMEYMENENFESASAIWKMVEEIQNS